MGLVSVIIVECSFCCVFDLESLCSVVCIVKNCERIRGSALKQGSRKNGRIGYLVELLI